MAAPLQNKVVAYMNFLANADAPRVEKRTSDGYYLLAD
jgi:hypothetical protein